MKHRWKGWIPCVLLSGMAYGEVDFSLPPLNPESRRMLEKRAAEKLVPTEIQNARAETQEELTAEKDQVVSLEMNADDLETTASAVEAQMDADSGMDAELATSGNAELPAEPLDLELKIPMELKGLIRELVRRNTSLTMDRLQIHISKYQERYERELFEPVFKVVWKKVDISSPTTAAETLSKGGNPFFSQADERLVTSLSGLLPSGADWSLELSHNSTKGTVVESFKNYENEYTTQSKLSLRQPLWKGMGSKVVLAEYHKAVLDAKILKGSFEKRMMLLIEMAVKEFWKFYGGQQLLASLETSVALSEESVALLSKKLEQGESSELELLEAQSGLVSRRLEYNTMKSKVEESKNNLLEMLNIPSENSQDLKFEALVGDVERESKTLQECYALALSQHPDVKIAEGELQKAKVDYHQKKNDLYPQLDLKASTWLSQLDSGKLYGHLFDKQYKSWEVSVEFSIPLTGGQRERSALAMSQLRAEQSQEGVISLKRRIKVALQTKLAQLKSALVQEADIQKSYEIKKQIFEIERKKLALGESHVREVLVKEEDMISEHRRLMNKMIEAKYAQVALDQWMGALSNRYVDTSDIYQWEPSADLPELHMNTFVE